MAYQFSTAVRNAVLDQIETAIGPAPTLKIRTGVAPANCAAADSGTVLASLALPSDWMAAAASGAKTKSGTWQDISADSPGEAGHFRIYDSGGTCHLQGATSSAWSASKAYALGATVHNGGSVYRAVGAGTSASSGGPSGTGSSIADGTVTWAYVQMGTDLTLDSGTIITGQQVTVTSFEIDAGGA